MKPRKIKEGVYWLGAIDWDRRLFDSLIPLPDGTSYNAYLIAGSEKTALLDTVDPANGRNLHEATGRDFQDRLCRFPPCRAGPFRHHSPGSGEISAGQGSLLGQGQAHAHGFLQNP